MTSRFLYLFCVYFLYDFYIHQGGATISTKNHIGHRPQRDDISDSKNKMLGVIEHFAKSLKIIRNGILEKGVNPC